MPTPFELRFSVLSMARELLCEEYYSKKEAITQKWETECENAVAKGQDRPMPPQLPTFPSESDIIAKAEKLNGFVSTAK